MRLNSLGIFNFIKNERKQITRKKINIKSSIYEFNMDRVLMWIYEYYGGTYFELYVVSVEGCVCCWSQLRSLNILMVCNIFNLNFY